MEIWKDIVNYEDEYEVSNLGRIRRKSGIVNSGIKNSNSRFIKGGILKQHLKRNGYLSVDLSKNHKVKTISVHRIVATAFLEFIDDKNQVNHKNGNKQDNRVENLEWVNASENRIHAFETGLQKGRGRKVRCNQLNLTFESTYAAAEYVNNKFFKNAKQVRNMSSKIRSCALGIQKSAYGLTWNYI